MKIAIEILKKKLNNTIEDKLLYAHFLIDKSNSIELNEMFKEDIKDCTKIIESCQKAIELLKKIQQNS